MSDNRNVSGADRTCPTLGTSKAYEERDRDRQQAADTKTLRPDTEWEGNSEGRFGSLIH